MPVHYNNSLDDELRYDLQSNYVGGQVSNFRSNLLDESQVARLQDFDVELNGQAKTRFGWHNSGDLYATSSSTNCQGLWFYDTPAAQRLYAFVNGKAYYTTDYSTWTTVSPTSWSTTARVHCEQIVDSLYACDGVSGHYIKRFGSTNDDAENTASHTWRFLVADKFRLFAADTEDQGTIHVSGYLPSGNTILSSSASFRVGEGGGSPITGLTRWQGYDLITFTAGSTYLTHTGAEVVTGSAVTDVAQFTTKTVSENVGCASHTTIQRGGTDLYWLARDGVRSMKQVFSDNVNTTSKPISFPIDDIFQRINWGAIDQACSAFWKDSYYLALPLDSDTVPSIVVVLNTSTGGWRTITGLSPVSMTITRFSGESDKLVMLDASGNVLICQDYQPWASSSRLAHRDRVHSPAAMSNVDVDASGVATVTAPTGNIVRSGDEVVISGSGVANLNGSYTAYGHIIGSTNDTFKIDTSVATGTYTTSLGTFISYHTPLPSVITKAMTFGDQLSPKVLDSIEVELWNTEGRANVYIIVDGVSQHYVGYVERDDVGNDLYLPFYLDDGGSEGPYLSPETTTSVIRKRFSLSELDVAREPQVMIEEAVDNLTAAQHQNAGAISLRSITLSGYMDTVEPEE